MWKPRHFETPSAISSAESSNTAPAIPVHAPRAQAAVQASHQSTLGKGLKFVGIISGEEESPEPLLIEGSVEGSITLPGNRVTVGHEAQVTADIIARDIVVMGRIDGNLTASVSLEIYANGAVTGDVSAARIRVEDGAFMKGNVNVRKAVTEPAAAAEPVADTPETREISSARPHVRPQHVHHTLQPA